MKHRSGRLTAAIALALLVADLVVLQVHVFTALKLAVADRGLTPTPRAFLEILRTSGRVDLLGPVVVLGLLLALLIALQIRSRSLSEILLDAVATPRGAMLATLVVSAVAVRYYVDSGLPHQYDAKLHTMRVAQTARLLAAGEWPDWTFTFYAGFPLLRFAGPLFYVIAAGASLLLGSVALGIKLTLVLAHLGGAIAVFALVRRLGGTTRAAFLGGIGAAISFQHTYAVVVAGRMPVALLYTFFPLLLLVAEGLVRRLTLRGVLGFGVLAALLVLSHPGLAPYGIASAAVFFAIRTVTRPSPLSGLLRGMGALAGAGLVCALLVAFLVVPALIERPSVHLSRLYTSSGLQFDATPDLGRLANLAIWRNLAAVKSITYVGLSLLGLFGLALFWRGIGASRRMALGGTAALLMFLIGGAYLSSRSVHFLVPLLAAGAGLAVDRFGSRGFAILALLLIIDLGPTTFQSPFRPDLDEDRAFVARAADHVDGGRVIRVSRRDGQYATSQWASVYDVDLALPTGPFREAACGDMFPWIRDLLRRLQDDLTAGTVLTPPTLLGLRCLGCEWILFEDGTRAFVPDLVSPGVRPDHAIPAIAVTGAGPAVAVLSEDQVAGLLSPRVKNWQAALDAAPDSLRTADARHVRVLDRSRANKRMTLRLEADVPGLLLLSVAHLPGVRVVNDSGEELRARAGPFGLVLVPIDAGPTALEVRFVPPSYLGNTRLVSGLALLAVLALLGFSALRRRAP